MSDPVQAHYTSFLAGKYCWISGGMEKQIRKNRSFFTSHALTPRDNRIAVDLGAGCGFQSVPLAQLGYSVTAVDFCGSLLEELRSHAGNLPVRTIPCDIRQYSSWSGRHPELIVCMGDTLAHLPALADAGDLIRTCFSELAPGGRMVLSLRDYSQEPDHAVVVIPVLREHNRIFLCRLHYHPDTLTVQDILYSRGRGRWERTAGEYTKIRILPDELEGAICRAGFTRTFSEVNNGIVTIIAIKERGTLPGS